MGKCKTCNGDKLVPIRNNKEKIVNPMCLEECSDCNGTGLESLIESSESEKPQGNWFLDFIFGIWKNQNPFEL